MRIFSSAFGYGEPIPRRFTADGDDVSPPLAWSDVPDGTREFALICDDPDAPTPEPWVHWVIFHLPADSRSLPEDVSPVAQPPVPAGAQQGRNSWKSGRTLGYRGPAPPAGHGTHHYRLRLYAINRPLERATGMTKATVLKAIDGHLLEEAELVGTYQR